MQIFAIARLLLCFGLVWRYGVKVITKKKYNVQYIFDANAIFFYFMILIIQAIIFLYICNGLSYGLVCESTVVLSRVWVCYSTVNYSATWT